MPFQVDERASRAPLPLRLRQALSLVLPLLLPFLAVLAAINAGHAGTRALQMLVLALPGLFWLWWPMRTAGRRRLQGWLCLLMGLAFVLDGAVRAFLLSTYDALPDSAMVLSAVANTTRAESQEFASMYWRDMLEWSLFALLCAGVLAWGMRLWWRNPPRLPEPRGWRIALAVPVLALILGSLVSSPWRRHHPALFWPHWVQAIGDLHHQWGELEGQRQRLLAAARRLAPTLAEDSPDTLVLVISESLNRNNMSSYGYARPTSPKLFARQRELGERMEVFRHAWSVNATTVPALRNFFYFGTPETKERGHLLALARAAGYRTWWITNQDDLAIEQEHARLANTVEALNRKPGRGAEALDEHVLPVLRSALADPAPRKLIVIHMLGLHPNYASRHPASVQPFLDAADGVDARLRHDGRPAWLRAKRNEYDSALRYHDQTVAATLDLSRHAPGRQTWVYLSDHGQEVGHTIDRAGHSPSTPDGYRIPLMVWSSYQDTAPGSVLSLPVRGDWLAYSLTNLLGIEWKGDLPGQDVFDPRYRWQPPRLPVRIDFNS
jgi:heptose-I-phosphate ethanolaminephosphotransferase